MKNVKVLVPLACGFEEIEAVSIIDVLRRAKIEVLLASLDEKAFVVGAHGITIQTDLQTKNVDVDTLDMIVLPGGWGATKLLAGDKTIQNILQEMDKKGKNIGAICAAPFALHKAGILKQKYTCYPSIEEQIREEGYMNDSAMVVEDENIMTSRGPATALCFALQIVKKLKGEEIYLSVKSELLVDFCE
ncbi:MAG: DJ-1 family glyoxalase III [Sulfurimonas sp.]|jgi:4-methyl-5(b-hydroxyethyl)-thiazole monophosphate biosynthesis